MRGLIGALSAGFLVREAFSALGALYRLDLDSAAWALLACAALVYVHSATRPQPDHPERRMDR